MNTPRIFLLALLSAGGLCAQASGIPDAQISASTSTQAILRYTAPEGTVCSLEVSESPNYAPLVHDVDPALFPESHLDSRKGNISYAASSPGGEKLQHRLFVIGKRAAETALDGRRYSRALQTYTLHYYRLRCGSLEARGTFRTANIPLGKTYSDALPPEPQIPGEYAWPEFVTGDRAESVVDPLTGILLKRISLPQDRNYNSDGLRFSVALDPDDAWQDEAQALSDNRAAKYTGTSSPQKWLFLRPDSVGASYDASYNVMRGSTDYIQVVLKAWCSGASCENASAADRSLEVCLTVNGVDCASSVKEVMLRTAPEQLVIGTTEPGMAYWGAAGQGTISTADVATRTGTVDTQGTAVRRRSGSLFNTRWKKGSRIQINGVEYRVESVLNPERLTLETSAGDQQDVAYRAPNFGVLLRKRSASAEEISVQGARWNSGASAANFDYSAGGNAEICASKPVTAADGKVGYFCNLTGQFYFIDPVTGESRYLGTKWMPGRGGTDGWPARWCEISSGAFDPEDPATFYCVGPDNGSPSRQVLFRGRYKGDYMAHAGEPDGRDQSDRFEYTNLTKSSEGRDLGSLIAAFDPGYRPDRFSCSLQGVHTGKVSVICLANGQESMGWVAVYDLRENRVIAARNSWSKAPARWCSLHGGAPLDNGWVTLDGNPLPGWSGPGMGPYRSALAKTPLPAGAGPCPARPDDSPIPAGEWPTGERCSATTVDGEPCDPTPAGYETEQTGNAKCGNAAHAYLQDAQPGDIFQVDQEYVRLVLKDGNTWTLQRAYNKWTGPAQHAAGSLLTAVCGDAPVPWEARSFGKTFWNYAQDPRGDNVGGTGTLTDPFDAGTHWAYGAGAMLEAAWMDCPEVAGKRSCYKIREGGLPGFISAAPRFANMSPAFAGVTGAGEPNPVQTHISYLQTKAEAQEWALDMRPFLGPGAQFGESRAVAGSRQLYRVAVPPLERKKLATFAVCGHHPLRDISGPKSLIRDEDADAYTYCVVDKAGECRPDTTGGDVGAVYVNCPYVTTLECSLTGAGMWELHDICVGRQSMYTQGMAQVGLKWDDRNAEHGRLLTNGLSRYRQTSVYWNAKALPDGSWAVFRADWLGGTRSEMLMAKLPPFPQSSTAKQQAPDLPPRRRPPQESTSLPDGARGDFIGIPLPVVPPQGVSVDNAVVEFGYAENGAPSDFYCTSRREACVKGSQDGNEYGFASDSVKGVACSAGCTITLPGISQRVLYYRVKYRDRSDRTVGESAPCAVAVP